MFLRLLFIFTLISAYSFASDFSNPNLSLDLKQKLTIIDLLINSKEARDDYFGGSSEASVSSVMQRDFNASISVLPFENFSPVVKLNCKNTSTSNVLSCALSSRLMTNNQRVRTITILGKIDLNGTISASDVVISY